MMNKRNKRISSLYSLSKKKRKLKKNNMKSHTKLSVVSPQFHTLRN
jgi:hypothetical protein